MTKKELRQLSVQELNDLKNQVKSELEKFQEDHQDEWLIINDDDTRVTTEAAEYCIDDVLEDINKELERRANLTG